ncbi:hypothetical protein [Peterkaempfera griseoplana]|uniref:hypothetical protein n=1 Tax=Peterkaempfera griseoplana TaxID=66896 RepID=UPI0006E2B927|nr:hypothetical protein [Peterkaempfera griseoplana]
MVEEARPTWGDTRDTDALQQYLKDRGCNGIEAVFVTMHLLGCGLGEAQRAFFLAPCREAEREFHNRAMDLLAQWADSDG